jgi:Lar family restriction alleviation protein
MKTRTAEEEVHKLRADNERLNNAWHMLDWAVRATIAAGHLDDVKFQTAMEMSKTLGRPAQIVDPEAFSAADTVGPGDALFTAKMTQGLTVVAPSIAPCPFCGNEDCNAQLIEIPSEDRCYFRAVVCGKCHCEGPIEDTDDAAIAAWNKRQAAP